jgi:hypothetical protein
MNKNILKIPYSAVREDWDLLQQFLNMKGNPNYIIVGDVNLSKRQDIFDLENLVGVEGDLDLSDSTIESLGELEYVAGNLTLYDSFYIKTLGNLKKVDGYLNLFNSHIESLGELEYVEGGLNLMDCQNIKTLGKLKFVGGGLNIEYTNIPPYELDNVEVAGSMIN